MIFLAIGFGVTAESWFPNYRQRGKNYKLPDGLLPLKRHKDSFSVIQNTNNQYSAEAHWGSTFWLTGADRYGEPGSSFHNTVSVDQVAARYLGQETRFSSIRLNGADPAISGVGHGPGLSLSWDEKGKPWRDIMTLLSYFIVCFQQNQCPCLIVKLC